jgi:putative ABC transport system ATP-binding protein
VSRPLAASPPLRPDGAGPVVVAERVAKEYPYAGASVHALRGIDLTIAPAEWVAIMGPSGCGKSTLLNVLAGIDSPSEGRVELLGRPIHDLAEGERARMRLASIGFVFQRFHLLPVLTALENVELPMAELGVTRRERRRRAGDLLGYVGLDRRSHHRPPQLSGGEQQRVAIARALANQPGLIFADEPTGELDQKTGEEILELFARLNDDGVTLVTVTHDAGVAARARRIVRMEDGRIQGIEHA